MKNVRFLWKIRYVENDGLALGGCAIFMIPYYKEEIDSWD